MKLILIILLSSNISSCIQNDARKVPASIIISDINVKYGGEIRATIKNRSNKPLWFLTRIERCNDGKWEEVILKIKYGNPYRAVPITQIKMQLKIDDNFTCLYDTGLFDSNSVVIGGKFRIRMDYGDSSDLGYNMCSENFQILREK